MSLAGPVSGPGPFGGPLRAHGLDSLRALAITLVFAYHYMVFVSREATFGWVSVVGWVGVDLFFVLSGYLIANQLFVRLAQGQAPALGPFYGRRALRTLPVFWLVLAAYMLWPAELGGRTPPPLWRFLSFTQNFQLPPGTAFSHAWSLCIEEQFYLVLPLLLWLGLRLHAGVRVGWLVMAALLGLGILARAVMWARYGTEAGGQLAGYHPNLYYATLCRFDEFLPGVAVAMLKHFHPDPWKALMAQGRAVLVLGLVISAAMLYGVHEHYYTEGIGYGWFMTVFGYSLNAMAFAVLVVAALSPASWLHRVRIPGALQLALWSYSIYLSHKAVAHLLHQGLGPLGLPSLAEAGVIALACIVVGAALYRAVEQPFLQLRERWFPLSARGEPARPHRGSAELPRP